MCRLSGARTASILTTICRTLGPLVLEDDRQWCCIHVKRRMLHTQRNELDRKKDPGEGQIVLLMPLRVNDARET